MGIPARTRIILLTGDRTREYGITRPMVILLMALAAVLLITMVFLMVRLGGKHEERQQIARLEADLDAARAALGNVEVLREELFHMQGLQEKLLFALGVQEAPPANPDSLAAWLECGPGSAEQALGHSAALALSPKPDHWPATGFVTQEFRKGAPNRGIVPHEGIDIAGPTGAPITTAGPGRVARVGTDDFLGNFVEIQHGLGYLTVYGHCDRVVVQADE
ncbi:hypothetical protein CSA17_03865, partial [bacterium DOLJORAL78_65_58]